MQCQPIPPLSQHILGNHLEFVVNYQILVRIKALNSQKSKADSKRINRGDLKKLTPEFTFVNEEVDFFKLTMS
jgi:hypothetical protein